jgi:hypothetical protein
VSVAAQRAIGEPPSVEGGVVRVRDYQLDNQAPAFRMRTCEVPKSEPSRSAPIPSRKHLAKFVTWVPSGGDLVTGISRME